MSNRKLLNCVCIFLYLSYTPASYAYDFKSYSYGIAVSNNVFVVDGDTVYLKINGEWQKIRLQGIDAPETFQPYGGESTVNLASCLKGSKFITFEWSKKDKYGRKLGKILADSLDCNLEQIRNGFAWHYKYYQEEQSLTDQVLYSTAEAWSRALKIGLWKDKCIIAPWDWRRKLIYSDCVD